ncbi:MAG: 50S ribosomal protein L2, partial [Mesorhizobium sp.]
MALKKFNPITPSTRQLVIVDRSGLYKGKPVKGLTQGLTKSGGRNNYGRITARFIGGGHKRTYRIIDFKRRKFDMPLASMPVGTIVHNIELKPGKGAQVARSAGGYAQLVGRDQGMAILRLNSGEQRVVHGSCMATVGAVSNPDHGNIN